MGTDEREFPWYRFILTGYEEADSGDVTAYRFGLLRGNQGNSSLGTVTEDWISSIGLNEFLREYGSLVVEQTKEMLSDGSFRWRVPAFNRDEEVLSKGRAALVFNGGSNITACFYLLSETGSFIHKEFTGGDARKIKERLFNGELLLADEEFISDEYKRIATLGEDYRRKYSAEVARDALTKRNISEIYLSEDGELCARGLNGVSNGVNSYPSFVRGVTVSARTLYDSKTEVLDMSRCAGLKSFEIYVSAQAYRKKLPRLSLVFPTELRADAILESCHMMVSVDSEELNFINFPKVAIFNKLIVTGAKIEGIDSVIKVEECEICNCTGLSELSIEAGAECGALHQSVRLISLDTAKLSVTVDSLEYCEIGFFDLKYLKELIFTVSKEATNLYSFTSRHTGFNIGSCGLEALVLESKEGLIFGGCADFASVYSSLKRLEIRGDIVFGNNVEDEVVFVPKGCKVVCNNAEFIKHVRER